MIELHHICLKYLSVDIPSLFYYFFHTVHISIVIELHHICSKYFPVSISSVPFLSYSVHTNLANKPRPKPAQEPPIRSTLPQHPPITCRLSRRGGVACLWTGQWHALSRKAGGTFWPWDFEHSVPFWLLLWIKIVWSQYQSTCSYSQMWQVRNILSKAPP